MSAIEGEESSTEYYTEYISNTCHRQMYSYNTENK